MVFLFIAWMAAYYVVGFAALAGLTKWRIAIPAAVLALIALVGTWPAVDYADTPGAIIGLFAFILFVSGAAGGWIVASTNSEIRDLDERTRLLGVKDLSPAS